MSWKQKLTNLDLRVTEDIDFLTETATEAKENDVGVINSISGAGILARENGDLEGYADYGLGFRFSRKKQALMVFAPSVHVFTQNLQKHTDMKPNSYLKDELKDVHDLLQLNNKIESES